MNRRRDIRRCVQVAIWAIVIVVTTTHVVHSKRPEPPFPRLSAVPLTGIRRAPAAVDRRTVTAPCRTTIHTVDEQDLAYWQAAGVQFAGPWHTDELRLVIGVLNQFSATFGQVRFLVLIDEALQFHPGSDLNYLTIVKHNDTTISPGAWAPSLDALYFGERLFDKAYVDRHYRWPVLDRAGSVAPRAFTTQEAIVAHELGHVLADAARVRRNRENNAAPSLEEIYMDEINRNLRAHAFDQATENLATEIGLWGLGIRRPHQIQAYRNTYLAPYLLDLPVKSLAKACRG